MLALTHHFRQPPENLLQTLPSASSFLASVIGLCLAFVVTSSWESKGDRARGGSKRALAKPFMVRGVPSPRLIPQGRWSPAPWPLCMARVIKLFAFIFRPSYFSGPFLGYTSISAKNPQLAQELGGFCSWKLFRNNRSHSLRRAAPSPAASNQHCDCPGNDGVNTLPASMQRMPGRWVLEPILCSR